MFKSLSIIVSLFLLTISSNAIAQSKTASSDSTVMVMMMYDDGDKIMNMTGFVIDDTKDENGNHYIVTARHGIKGENNEGFNNVTGINIFSWDTKLIGKAKVAYCDNKWGDIKTNIEHDFCVLSIIPEESDLNAYNQIDGYKVSKILPAINPVFCSDGIISWTHGSSGSPLIIDGKVYGLLSVTFKESSIPYQDWKDKLKDNNIGLPKRVVASDEPKEITTKSCAMFPAFSPKTIAYLQLDSSYQAKPISSDSKYDTFGYPQAFRAHIFKDSES